MARSTPAPPLSTSRPAYPGGASTFLFAHRAFVRRMDGRRAMTGAFALALVVEAAWVAALPYVAFAWGQALAFINTLAGSPGRVVMTVYDVFGVWAVGVPSLDWPATEPTPFLLGVTGVVVAVLFVASFFFPERHTPAVYLLRAVLLLQGSAVMFFAVWPGRFPYTLTGYGQGMTGAGLAIATAVPLVLALTYYVHDLGFARKVGLTVAALAHSVVLVPLLYAAHAALVATGSLLFLPALYFLAGIPLHVMTLVALYAGGMSWRGPAAAVPA
ncbi:MAG TPA: hypothetical protein VK610_05385 [Rhodothermales bacterium]|nr:hypothetical protein [Rhodothermales bacterium]